MNSTRKKSFKELEETHFRETFGRQWDVMKDIEDWKDVYIWEVDGETITFANERTRTLLLMTRVIYDDHTKEIAKSLSKKKQDIKVEDILTWLSNRFSVKI